MNAENIVVGQKYVHPQFPGCVFLGVGYAVWNETDNFPEFFTNRKLVVIESQDKHYVGIMVQDKEKCAKGFWDKFEILQ